MAGRSLIAVALLAISATLMQAAIADARHTLSEPTEPFIRRGRSLLTAVDTEDKYEKKYANQNMLTWRTADNTIAYSAPQAKNYTEGIYTVAVFPGAGSYNFTNGSDTDYFGCFNRTYAGNQVQIVFFPRLNAAQNTCPYNLKVVDSEG